jgi:tetratricopeptide (TPR) repeat protein
MKILSLLLCLLILSSCASTPQSRLLRTNAPGSLPAVVELADTPFYPQTAYQCGPAALATIFESHGLISTPEELASQVYIPERKGSLQVEMSVAARHHELLPYALAPQLVDLFAEVAAGNPVLVLQNLGFDWYPQWHYAVVIGYDLDSHEVILRSGTTRRWITPIDVFERTWKRADFWALVIVPVGEIPVTAQPLPYLATAYAFEETGHPKLAAKAYLSASKQWPEVDAIWIAIGNLAFESRHWAEAVTAFTRATAIQPGSIISWNNLAYALHASGCHAAAREALKCALTISPADKNLQASWHELTQQSGDTDETGCQPVRCK